MEVTLSWFGLLLLAIAFKAKRKELLRRNVGAGLKLLEMRKKVIINVSFDMVTLAVILGEHCT